MVSGLVPRLLPRLDPSDLGWLALLGALLGASLGAIRPSLLNDPPDDDYQVVEINLVSRGFVVLAFDPIGQGERMQYVHYTYNTK